MNKDIIYKSAKRVYEQLGFGLSESAYQEALKAELEEHYNDVQSEYHIAQFYITSKGRKKQIADLRIDLLLDDNIILELKTISSKLTKVDKKTGEIKIEDMKTMKEYKQCYRYQKIKNIKEGYLINFGEKGLDFITIIN